MMTTKTVLTLADECSCSLHVDRNGYGKCKKPFPAFNNQFVCFVNEPTSCSDVYNFSSEQVERRISAQACQETQASDVNTNGALSEEDFLMAA